MRSVDDVLVPGDEVVGALDHIARVGVQPIVALVAGGAGKDPLDQRGDSLLDAMQLLPSPLVGLVEIEVGAVVVAHEQPVSLGPDRVVWCRRGRVVVPQPPSEFEERVGGGT